MRGSHFPVVPLKSGGSVQVDLARNLIYVKGQVTGHKGNFVYIKDSVKKTYTEQPPRPFPTANATGGARAVQLLPQGSDPYGVVA